MQYSIDIDMHMIFSYECLKDNHIIYIYTLAPLKTDTFHPVDLARFEVKQLLQEGWYLVEDVL